MYSPHKGERPGFCPEGGVWGEIPAGGDGWPHWASLSRTALRAGRPARPNSPGASRRRASGAMDGPGRQQPPSARDGGHCGLCPQRRGAAGRTGPARPAATTTRPRRDLWLSSKSAEAGCGGSSHRRCPPMTAKRAGMRAARRDARDGRSGGARPGMDAGAKRRASTMRAPGRTPGGAATLQHQDTPAPKGARQGCRV